MILNYSLFAVILKAVNSLIISALLADGGQFDSGRHTNDVELLTVCGHLESGQLTDDRCITR